MDLSTRVWSTGRWLVLAGALFATYFLFAAAAMRVAVRAREVLVPRLASRSVNDAATVLEESGLRLRVEEARRIDPKIAAGLIVAQEPGPGVTTRSGRSVRVWVSAGPRATIVPALVGESERTAMLRLQSHGLLVAGAAEIRSTEYPAGAVVAQDPPPEARGAAVTLLVNRGEPEATYVMPDLIGVNGDRASDLLRARGFRVSIVGEHPYPGVPGGVVLRQNPQAGFQISPGHVISLEVSK
jgi:beta-lactam-binding protein with PASTA domain